MTFSISVQHIPQGEVFVVWPGILLAFTRPPWPFPQSPCVCIGGGGLTSPSFAGLGSLGVFAPDMEGLPHTFKSNASNSAGFLLVKDSNLTWTTSTINFAKHLRDPNDTTLDIIPFGQAARRCHGPMRSVADHSQLSVQWQRHNSVATFVATCATVPECCLEQIDPIMDLR